MSVSFRDLEKQYGGFTRPFLSVSVDGAPDKSPDVFIRNVEITLTCGYEASACTFELSGRGSAFEGAELKLDPAVRKYLKLGAKLELSTGYRDAEHCAGVFTGFVTAAALKLEGARIFHVIEAMDCKALMMNGLRSGIWEGLKKDSEAAAAVLKDYGSAAAESEIGETGERGAPIARYARSDYDFLVELARRNRLLFFVDRGRVRIVPDDALKTVSVVLTPGSHLYRLERAASLVGRAKSVTVLGFDQADPEKPVTATAVKAAAVGGGERTAAEDCALVGEAARRTLFDDSVRTAEQARARAEAEWGRAAAEFVTGSFETVGAPALLPGALVTLESFDASVNGDYLITEAVHKLDVGSYRTVCRFRRSKD